MESLVIHEVLYEIYYAYLFIDSKIIRSITREIDNTFCYNTLLRQYPYFIKIELYNPIFYLQHISLQV